MKPAPISADLLELLDAADREPANLVLHGICAVNGKPLGHPDLVWLGRAEEGEGRWVTRSALREFASELLQFAEALES